VCIMAQLVTTPTTNSVVVSAEEGTGIVAGLQLLIDAARGSSKSCELLLQGTFHPNATISLNWPDGMEQQLVIRPEANASIAADELPEDADTMQLMGKISLQGVHFPGSKGHAVVVQGKNTEGYEIRDCDFKDCTAGAIRVWINESESIVTEVPRIQGRIVDNRICGFNRIDAKWKNEGICVFGQGCLISGNYICDSPTETMGIRAMGRDIVIEHNYVANVSVRDSGAIYLGVKSTHGSTFRGRKVRWNCVVNSGSVGIYVDDGSSGAYVMENVVIQSALAGIWVSGGRDNTIERNIVDGAEKCFHIDSRALGWKSNQQDFEGCFEKSLGELTEWLADSTKGPILRERYPELQRWNSENLTAELYGRPENNTFEGNFARGFETEFHLADFSPDVKADFAGWNTLTPVTPLEEHMDLQSANLMEQFGFQGLMSLSQVAAKARAITAEC